MFFFWVTLCNDYVAALNLLYLPQRQHKQYNISGIRNCREFILNAAHALTVIELTITLYRKLSIYRRHHIPFIVRFRWVAATRRVYIFWGDIAVDLRRQSVVICK